MSALVRYAGSRYPCRMSKARLYKDQNYKKLFEVALSEVTLYSRFEKRRVMRLADVYSLTAEAVNWDLIRREIERSLKVDLVPVTQVYFDERPWRRKSNQSSLFAELDADNARRYLAYSSTPSGYISATSPGDKAIVEASLDTLRRVADGVTQRAVDVSREVAAAEARRAAARKPSAKRLVH
jgi:hypothetical protein